MTRVLVAVADRGLAQQIRSWLSEVGDVEVTGIASSSGELADHVTRDEVDVVLVHDGLGPEPVLAVIRDLGIRRPATAAVLVTARADADTAHGAMEAGVRGIVHLPISLGQLQARVGAAAEHATRLRSMLAAGRGVGPDDSGRGRLLAFAGSKGGVGVTTVATHLAVDLKRTVPELDVCLVDLDIEKGDVPGFLEVRHKVGLIDLAKVADDLSPGIVGDALTRHESGVDLLLGPLDAPDAEHLSPRALRQVLAALRGMYDVVVLDLGSHASVIQTSAVELADEVVLVVAPDVPSLRGMRRAVQSWESLGVARERDVRVVVNRVSRRVTVSMDTVRRLTQAVVVEAGLPAAYQALEESLNVRDPRAVRSRRWWDQLRRVGNEIGIREPGARPVPARPGGGPRTGTAEDPADGAGDGTGDEQPGDGSGGGGSGATARTRARSDDSGRAAARREESGRAAARRRIARAEAGALSIEAVCLVPLFAALAMVCFHVAMYGTALVLHAHASGAAARAAAVGADPEAAARDSLPDFLAGGVTASFAVGPPPTGGGTVPTAVPSPAPSVPVPPGTGTAAAGGAWIGSVTVTIPIPGAALGVIGLPTTVTGTRPVAGS